jgi:hypothetical protein
VSFSFNIGSSIRKLLLLKYHLIGSTGIFVQEAQIQLMEKPQDMTELSTNYVTFTKLLLVSEGINRQVVSVSALVWFIRFILQLCDFEY